MAWPVAEAWRWLAGAADGMLGAKAALLAGMAGLRAHPP